MKKYGFNTPRFYPSDKSVRPKPDKHTNVMESFCKHHAAARCHASVKEFLKGPPAVNRLKYNNTGHLQRWPLDYSYVTAQLLETFTALKFWGPEDNDKDFLKGQQLVRQSLKNI